MKGLVLNCTGPEKKEEAYALVKAGLRNDMRSHVCWHVHGLLHRSDKEYGKAIKAYKQALKIDEKNMQILKDISLLQIHMRDLPGFVQTRRMILVEKSNSKQNWMGFAVAHHLTGKPEMALTVIDQYQATLPKEGQPGARRRDYEESELVQYRTGLLEEQGKVAEALALLEQEEKFVVDRFGWKVKRAELLLLLGDVEGETGGDADDADDAAAAAAAAAAAEEGEKDKEGDAAKEKPKEKPKEKSKATKAKVKEEEPSTSTAPVEKKKKANGYLLFAKDNRASIKAQLEEELDEGEKLQPAKVVSAVAAAWKKLSESEKEEWNLKAGTPPSSDDSD